MKDERKTKKQLIEELEASRQTLAKYESGDGPPDIRTKLAAERVRTAAMAMHSSSDLMEVGAVLYRELRGLAIRTFGVTVEFFEDVNSDQFLAYQIRGNPTERGIPWSNPGITVLGNDAIGWVDEDPSEGTWREVPRHRQQTEPWTHTQAREEVLAGAEEFYGLDRPLADYPDPSLQEDLAVETWHIIHVPISCGLVAFNEPEYVQEHVDAVRELAEGLSLGYVRFLDFQRLEEQNRNLEVEQALERVRTQVAAMQVSQDLFKVQRTVHEQLKALGVPCDGVGINIVGESAQTLRSYAPDHNGEEYAIPIDEDTPADLDWPREFLAHWREGTTWTRHWSREFYTDLMQLRVDRGRRSPEEAQTAIADYPPDGRWIVDVPFAQGTLAMSRPGSEPFSDDDIALLERFTEVFALAYTRYLDLQAAEERAEQSAREAAYERVRSAVLASRNTADILQANSLMGQELRGLGVPIYAVGINLIDEAAGEWRQFSGSATTLGLDVPLVAKIVAHWRRAEPYMRPAEYPDATIESIRDRDGEEGLRRLRSVKVIVDVPFTYGTLAMSSAELDEFSPGEIQILQGFGDVISLAYTRYLDLVAVEDAQRRKVAALEGELQTARDMQIGLMPTAAPETAGLSAAGRCVTVNHVGGDFFQYFEQDDGITVSLADVTGHAMEAAIPAVMFSGVLDKQMEIPTTLEGRFSGLNRSMCRSLGEHTYVCLSMLALDPAARTMRVANCGCPYPLHYQAGTGQIEEIQIEAYPLGIRPDTKYSAEEVALERGDYVVLHSDGFSEAANAEEQLFGFDRTMEVIRQGCSEGLSPEELIDRLIGEVKAFTGDEPQADDMTCVVIKVEA